MKRLKDKLSDATIKRNKIKYNINSHWIKNREESIELKNQYTEAKHEENEARRKLNEYTSHKPLLRLGEREAFVSYQHKSGSSNLNSWAVLSEMQHHGIPTRMLDWTDTLIITLYFALYEHRKIIEKFWFLNRKNDKLSRDAPLPFPDCDDLSNIPNACIWVLNPYRLSRLSSRRDRIWNLSLDENYDYYRNFIEKKHWPYEMPIPSYSPWHNDRISAQQGSFIVWGSDKRCLEDIWNTLSKKEKKKNGKIVKKVEMDLNTSIYGVRIARQLCGVDHFFMYRDKDSLGAKIRREFLHDSSDPLDYFE